MTAFVGMPAPTPAGAETLEGVNNAALAESRLRIIDNGSWKKQNVVLVLPASKTVPTKCALSWMNLAGAPNNGLARFPSDVFLVNNTEVGQAYSLAFEQILAHPQLKDFQYILTLEHDNVPAADGLLKLLRHMDAHPEFSCIGGLYWTKGADALGVPTGVPQIWGDPRDPICNFRPQPPKVPNADGTWPDGHPLVECWGTGMGFNLWRLDMFRDTRLRKPWFKTEALAPGDKGVGTQDLYAWTDLRKWGYRCAVACDVLVGHHDLSTSITW